MRSMRCIFCPHPKLASYMTVVAAAALGRFLTNCHPGVTRRTFYTQTQRDTGGKCSYVGEKKY